MLYLTEYIKYPCTSCQKNTALCSSLNCIECISSEIVDFKNIQHRIYVDVAIAKKIKCISRENLINLIQELRQELRRGGR